MTSDEKKKFECRDVLHQPIIIHRLKVGDYTITHQTHDGSFWIMDETGKGLPITKEKFEKLITDFYYEES